MYQVKLKLTANRPDNFGIDYYNHQEAIDIIDKHILTKKVEIEYDLSVGNEREISYLFKSKEFYTQLNDELLSYEKEHPDCVNNVSLEILSEEFLS